MNERRNHTWRRQAKSGKGGEMMVVQDKEDTEHSERWRTFKSECLCANKYFRVLRRQCELVIVNHDSDASPNAYGTLSI
jgi:hypothetical protein